MTCDTNGNVSIDQLKQFVLETMKDDMANKRVTKKDIEGFLSSFIYNNYGATNVDQIPSLIYTENYIENKLNSRVRANPPPIDAQGDFDLYYLDDNELHCKRTKDLMSQIEQKVFDGPVKMYQVFKNFDRDNDGYVSYLDFEERLGQLQINASQKEIAAVLRVLDKESKGYFD